MLDDLSDLVTMKAKTSRSWRGRTETTSRMAAGNIFRTDKMSSEGGWDGDGWTLPLFLAFMLRERERARASRYCELGTERERGEICVVGM